MLRTLARRFASEIALHRHNKANRRGVVSPEAQHYHVLNDVLPAPIHEGLLASIQADRALWVRSETSWRRGAAMGGHELRASASARWLDYLISGPFLEDVRQRTGMSDLEFVPEVDTNRLSLLHYRAADEGGEGDGVGWHVDGSIYLGARWAGILTLLEETTEVDAKLELAPHGKPTTLPAVTATNSLVLFQGDHVRHRVRPMLAGEERIVLSLLFSTRPRRTLNPFLRRYQSRVNLSFYGNAGP